MADDNNQPTGSGQSDQSSSQSSGQSASGQQSAAQAAASQSQSQTQKAERPDYVPESEWDPEKSAPKDTFGQYVKDHVAFKAAAESKRLTLPKLEEYKIERSRDFKGPEGVEIPAFNEQSPAIGNLRGYAVKHGLTQEAVSELLDIYTANHLEALQQFKAGRDAEIAKLGATAGNRVDAVLTFFKATLGEKQAAAMEPMLVTADIVRGFETIMQRLQTQGGASFSQAHRENAAATDKIEGYDKMTFAQKRAAQDALKSRNAAAR